MNGARIPLVLVLLCAASGALAVSLATGTGSQPQPGLRPVRDRQYAAWIPPGNYTSIVLCSSGDERRWAVSLMTRGVSVPIVVPPRDNIVVEFAEGWQVGPDDEARIVSRLVPFDDAARYNKFGEPPDYVISAWGITAHGPVEFVYREVD